MLMQTARIVAVSLLSIGFGASGCSGGAGQGAGAGGELRGLGGAAARGGAVGLGGGAGGASSDPWAGAGGSSRGASSGTPSATGGGLAASGGRAGVEGRDATPDEAGGAPGSGGAAGRSGSGGAAGRSGSGGASGGARTGAVDGGGGDSGGVADAAGLPLFSFFVTSLVAMRAVSGSENGFGGDLRFGETGPGAGLRGADKICAAVAERSMPGSRVKQWRAFVSTSTEDAIDRVGNGPWYDRQGRLVARAKADLPYTRPRNAHSMIANDLPNEDGVPNHAPDGITVDNHDMLTGSNRQGRLFGPDANCKDWTSLTGRPPRVGHSWPRSDMPGWIDAHAAGGCAAGVNLSSVPPPPSNLTVGAAGGYGGLYCFALVP